MPIHPETFAPSLVTPTRPQTTLERLPKSLVTTVCTFPVFRSVYTANSALSVVCHFLNKLSAMNWGAVHSPTLFFTSFLSYEIFPRSKRVFKTNSLGFFWFSGRDCDRIKLERFILLFPLHQKTKTFSLRISLIVAVMLSSSLLVRLFPPLQRITTIFFSVKEKTNWKLVTTSFIYLFMKLPQNKK